MKDFVVEMDEADTPDGMLSQICGLFHVSIWERAPGNVKKGEGHSKNKAWKVNGSHTHIQNRQIRFLYYCATSQLVTGDTALS